jgi:hypothetical protein
MTSVPAILILAKWVSDIENEDDSSGGYAAIYYQIDEIDSTEKYPLQIQKVPFPHDPTYGDVWNVLICNDPKTIGRESWQNLYFPDPSFTKPQVNDKAQKFLFYFGGALGNRIGLNVEKIVTFSKIPDLEQITQHLTPPHYYQLRNIEYEHVNEENSVELKFNCHEIRYNTMSEYSQIYDNILTSKRRINQNYALENSREAELENYNLLNWHKHGFKNLVRINLKTM